MGNKRKARASHAPLARKADAQRNPSAYEERTGGDTIQRAAGRVVHDEYDAAASRRPWHAWTQRCRSGTKAAQAADAELKSRDGAKTISETEASVSSEQELSLAPRAVNMTAEDGRLQAELSRREARQHRAWEERWPGHVDVLSTLCRYT